MAVVISLLDALAVEMQCGNISDLRFLNGGQRKLLARRLERLTAADADLRDWNDALAYLTGDREARPTAAQAKSALIAGLSAP